VSVGHYKVCSYISVIVSGPRAGRSPGTPPPKGRPTFAGTGREMYPECIALRTIVRGALRLWNSGGTIKG